MCCWGWPSPLKAGLRERQEPGAVGKATGTCLPAWDDVRAPIVGTIRKADGGGVGQDGAEDKGPSAKPDNQRWTPGTHMVEEESRLPKLSSDPHTPVTAQVYLKQVLFKKKNTGQSGTVCSPRPHWLAPGDTKVPGRDLCRLLW